MVHHSPTWFHRNCTLHEYGSPLADVVAATGVVAENMTIAIEEEAEERRNTDGVDEDEDSGRHGVRLVGV
jgi:hypothetical protein